MSGGMPVTGTATVVLGDVAGSTRLWQASPEAMEAASRRLATLAEELVAAHGGHRPREQGEGDNLVAVFASAPDAAAFALALDEALAAEPWPGGLSIAMRLGLHTGEVSFDEHTGYLGPTFNRCARLRDLGHARMLLLSSTMRDVIADALPDGTLLDDLGEHQLRDLSRSEQVFQLRAPGDDRSYAPLKSISSLPNNLPVPVTSLVGRSEEIRDVATLFRDHRLVTLVGPGGAGKTRLAQHVAAELVQHASDGAWWVDLMPVTEERQVPTAIAEAARLPDVTDTRSLVTAIGERRMLLVIDNCEHLVDRVAEDVEAMLARCPGVRVLTTTRELLDIDGEHTVRVRPLGLPDEGVEVSAAQLVEHEATRLFVERAAAVSAPPFDDDAATEVVEICRRLDGIPLAIELAAARTRVLPVTEIATGLDDRFTLLGARGRGRRGSRQRTLEASVSWSYELLDTQEQAVLARLGVFPGAFTLEGAAAVGWPGGSTAAVLDVVTSLVDKSLVTVRPDRFGRRYRLLETIRQFALDRLAEHDATVAANDAHLDHLLAVTAAWHERQVELLDDVANHAEWEAWADDVRTAVVWAQQRRRHADVPELLRVGQSWLQEFGGWQWALRAVLATDDRASDDPPGNVWRDTLAASLLAQAGAVDEAIVRADTAAAAAARGPHVGPGRPSEEALTRQLALIRALPYTSQAGRAIDVIDQALTEPGADRLLPRCHVNLSGAAAATLAGCHERVRPLAEAGLAAAAVRGHAPIVHVGRWMLAMDHFLHGRLTAAREVTLELYETLRRDRPRLLSMVSSGGAVLVLCSGPDGEAVARELVEEAVEASGAPGSPTRTHAEVGALLLAVATRDVKTLRTLGPTTLAGLTRAAPMWRTICSATVAIGAALDGDTATARRLLAEAPERPPGPAWGYSMSYVHGAQRLLADGDHRRQLAVAATELQRARPAVHYPVLLWLPAVHECAANALALGEQEAAALLTGGALAGRATIDGAYDTTSVPARLSLTELDGLAAKLADHRDTIERGRSMSAPELIDHALRTARRLGVNSDDDRTLDRPVSGWDALTPAERDIARAVAGGLTNKQVGEALFVSENTVKTHLKSVYAKLSVGSRAELATVVANRS